jgi:hypothetical protein
VNANEAAEREVQAEFGCEFQPHRISWLAGQMQSEFYEALGPAKHEQQRQLQEWMEVYRARSNQARTVALDDEHTQTNVRALRSLEIGAGSARLSRALHSLHSWEVTLVESEEAHIAWQPPFARDDKRVILWNVDYTMLDSDKLPCYDAIHASPDCGTFSQDGTGTHHRSESNHFCGVTQAAGSANKALDMLINMIAEELRRNPHSTFTLENPGHAEGSASRGGAMRHHPLIRQRLEQLPGVERFTVTYCFFGSNVQKPTG